MVYASDVRGAWALVACAVGCATPDERPDDWSYVHAAIIAPSCATSSCHSQVSSLAGIDLSTRTSAYVYLTGRTCGAPPHPQDPPTGETYVEPGNPRGSGLTLLLTGAFVPDGSSERLLMPPDQPLPGVEIELIGAWIAKGAPCD